MSASYPENDTQGAIADTVSEPQQDGDSGSGDLLPASSTTPTPSEATGSYLTAQAPPANTHKAPQSPHNPHTDPSPSSHDLNTASIAHGSVSGASFHHPTGSPKGSLRHGVHHRRIVDRTQNRLSTASLPQLHEPRIHQDVGQQHQSQQQLSQQLYGTTLGRLPGSQLSTRPELDLRSRYNKGKGRRRRHPDIGSSSAQLSPQPRSSSPRYNRGPPSPTSPVTPTLSARSVKSKRSSVRRSGQAAAAAAKEAAAAKQLEEHESLSVISRRMSSYRVVNLLYQTDADLFDAITEWKENHPDLWVDDAIDAFSLARGADALAQLVYSTEAFDIILKYNASHEDLATIFDVPMRGPPSPLPPSQTQQERQLQPEQSGASGPSAFPEGVYQSPVQHPHSLLSELRHSSASLLSRALSIRSQSRSRQSTPQLPQHQPLFQEGAQDDPRRASLPHVAITVCSSGNGQSTGTSPDPTKPPPSSPQTFALLQPLDCSTDLFPSVQLSRVAVESHLPTIITHSTNNTDRTQVFSSTSILPSCDSGNHWQQQQQGQPATSVPKFAPAPRRRKSARPSKAKMREWKIQLHRREFQMALLKEGVFIELEKSIRSDAVYVKVLAPFWRLEDEAQKTNCKADLAHALMPSIPYSSRIFPSITRLFPCLNQPGLEQRREAVLFKTARLTDFHLAEQGRRWSDIVRHAGAVRKDGKHVGSHSGTDGRPGFFQTSRRGYLVNSIMMRTESKNSPFSRKAGLRSALRHGAYQKLFALHDGSFKLQNQSIRDANYRAQLRVKWSRRFWKNQPLDLVNAYYGERVGIYFAWLGHYTKWLTLPAAVGVAVFIFGIVNAARLNKLDATPNALFAIFDNVLTMPFALFMSIWSTIYIEFWKRANQYYAYRWNMNDYERVELPRTEFRATKTRISAVTGKRELYYPVYWKALRYLISALAVIVAVSVVVGSVACLMIFKAWCRHHIGGPYGSLVAVAMLNLIIIIVLGEIWCRVAEWLTDKENHKYTEAYESSLIIKRYLFDFTNMYATLFYYAFFKAPFGGKIFRDRLDLQDSCLYDACITELTVQLAVVFIGKQFLNGIFEMLFPWLKRTWNRKKILADQALKRREFLETRKWTRAPRWVKDDDLPSYEGRILKCYRKTVIQFGFCTLFVTSFPIAPAFALINNWIDIRLEAFRLLSQYRRPIALRAQDIGLWERIMEFVSFCSVITNAAIIAFSSLWIKQNLFAKYLHANRDGELLAAQLGFILVFEHVVFLFKIILRASIPNVPLTIKLAVARSKYMSRVASEGLESEMDEDLDYDSPSDDDDGYSDYDYSDVESEEGSSPLGRRTSHSSVKIEPGYESNLDCQHTVGGGGGQDSPAIVDGKRLSRPGLGLQRVWSENIMRKKKPIEKSPKRESAQSTRPPPPPAIQTRGGNLPTIQESLNGSRTNSLSIYEQRQGAGLIGSPPGSQLQHGLGLGFSHISDPGQALADPPVAVPSQSREQLSPPRGQNRPIPQRLNTEMDGEWVVLEESRV